MSDLIDRQAAIEALCNDYCGGHQDCKYYPNCENLKSIEQLPSAQPEISCSEFPNNSDVVDRQKAKNAICNACGKIDCGEMDTCEKLDIPSEGSKLLQPWEVLVAQAVLPQSAEPKRGRWILDRSGAYCCSECMEPCAGYVMMKPRDKFCKMCGSRNEVTT